MVKVEVPLLTGAHLVVRGLVSTTAPSELLADDFHGELVLGAKVEVGLDAVEGGGDLSLLDRDAGLDEDGDALTNEGDEDVLGAAGGGGLLVIHTDDAEDAKVDTGVFEEALHLVEATGTRSDELKVRARSGLVGDEEKVGVRPVAGDVSPGGADGGISHVDIGGHLGLRKLDFSKAAAPYLREQTKKKKRKTTDF